jgi:hypothetical protein
MQVLSAIAELLDAIRYTRRLRKQARQARARRELWRSIEWGIIREELGIKSPSRVLLDAFKKEGGQ